MQTIKLNARYGRLVTVLYLGKNRMQCRCDCGKDEIYNRGELYRGRATECRPCKRRTRELNPANWYVRQELIAHLSLADQDLLLRLWRRHLRSCRKLDVLPSHFGRFVYDTLEDPHWRSIFEMMPITTDARCFSQYGVLGR